MGDSRSFWRLHERSSMSVARGGFGKALKRLRKSSEKARKAQDPARPPPAARDLEFVGGGLTGLAAPHHRRVAEGLVKASPLAPGKAGQTECGPAQGCALSSSSGCGSVGPRTFAARGAARGRHVDGTWAESTPFSSLESYRRPAPRSAPASCLLISPNPAAARSLCFSRLLWPSCPRF